MKISLEWLTDFLPGPLDATVAAETLTHGGLPVEVIEKHGDDSVIDVEVTSNRADCLSHVGVARELAALLKRELKELKPTMAEHAGQPTAVQIESQLCPHYTARVIKGVKIGPSPQWLRRRLEAIGVRPINNIVDVTNYVMFELGQPLHAFDFDKIMGRRIVVRSARPNESLVSIDGHERKLTADMLVIADSMRAVALAGVMGGKDSEVSDSTANVLLESARFDPLSVRTTSRKLALKSDSSYRFERGIDPTLPLRASLRAAQLIVETAGGELLPGVAQAGAESWQPRTVSMRVSRMNQLLGIEVAPQAAVDALARLGLGPLLKQDRIETSVPSWRADINLEVDLIEEVARVIGYDKIPVTEEISIRLAPAQPQQRTIETIRTALVGGGFFESITVTFVSDVLAEDFTPAGTHLLRADPLVRKADARLRPSLLPGLLEALRRNEAVGNTDVRLFEIGSTFTPGAETQRLGLVGGTDLRDIRGVIELLLERLDAKREVRVAPAQCAGLDPAACGRIEWGGRSVGFVGKVARPICDKLDLRHLPAAAELDLEPLLDGAQHVPQLTPLPRFPAVRRDLTLDIAESTHFDAIQRIIQQVNPANLEAIEYVGSYRGKQIKTGQKSVTLSLVFRSSGQTLTSQSVDEAMKEIKQAATRAGASLRG